MRPETPATSAPIGAPERLWSLADLARYLNCSRRHCERLLAGGRFIPPIRCGRLLRFEPSAIRSWVESQREGRRDA
jgi:excisionase family DNA binding protein